MPGQAIHRGQSTFPASKPGGKAITGALLVVALIAIGLFVLPRFERAAAPVRVDEKATLSILKSEAMAFLVTRRMATQIVVEHEECSWLGQWRGVLWTTVRLHYGVDLKKIEVNDIRRKEDTIIISLPEPELLDLAIEPGSEGFLSKSTAAAKIEDMLHGNQRRQLRHRLRQSAVEFAGQQGLLPTREEIVQQLNDVASMLKAPAGVTLRFE